MFTINVKIAEIMRSSPSAVSDLIYKKACVVLTLLF